MALFVRLPAGTLVQCSLGHASLHLLLLEEELALPPFLKQELLLAFALCEKHLLLALFLLEQHCGLLSLMFQETRRL